MDVLTNRVKLNLFQGSVSKESRCSPTRQSFHEAPHQKRFNMIPCHIRYVIHAFLKKLNDAVILLAQLKVKILVISFFLLETVAKIVIYFRLESNSLSIS